MKNYLILFLTLVTFSVSTYSQHIAIKQQNLDSLNLDNFDVIILSEDSHERYYDVYHKFLKSSNSDTLILVLETGYSTQILLNSYLKNPNDSLLNIIKKVTRYNKDSDIEFLQELYNSSNQVIIKGIDVDYFLKSSIASFLLLIGSDDSTIKFTNYIDKKLSRNDYKRIHSEMCDYLNIHRQNIKINAIDTLERVLKEMAVGIKFNYKKMKLREEHMVNNLLNIYNNNPKKKYGIIIGAAHVIHKKRGSVKSLIPFFLDKYNPESAVIQVLNSKNEMASNADLDIKTFWQRTYDLQSNQIEYLLKNSRDDEFSLFQLLNQKQLFDYILIKN